MKAVVTKPLGRETIHRGRGNAAAERTVLAEATVVDQYEEDVGRSIRSLHRLGELCGIGIEISAANLSRKMIVRARENIGCFLWARNGLGAICLRLLSHAGLLGAFQLATIRNTQQANTCHE